jgi:hypothetical protein
MRLPGSTAGAFSAAERRCSDAYGILFALGGRACGLIAVGGRRAVGLVAVGGIAVGGVALGGVALGGFALGGLGVGVVAIGGLALGWQALGGAAVAWDFAGGGAALARHAANGGLAIARDYAVGGAAWATNVNNVAADAIIADQPLALPLAWMMTDDAWATLAVCLVGPELFLLSLAPLLLLMYRRRPKRPDPPATQ